MYGNAARQESQKCVFQPFSPIKKLVNLLYIKSDLNTKTATWLPLLPKGLRTEMSGEKSSGKPA